MPNNDKLKAARGGKDLRYSQKIQAMHNAARVQHDNEKRVNGHQVQLRSFEDNGFGVATGKQHEHEENMRFRKMKLDEKKKKSKAFLMESMAAVNNGGGEEEAASGSSGDDVETDGEGTLRFAPGARVECRLGPRRWAAGQVVACRYREPSWPAGRFAPYQVRLDDDELIFAPSDRDDVIRAEVGATAGSSSSSGGGFSVRGTSGGRSLSDPPSKPRAAAGYDSIGAGPGGMPKAATPREVRAVFYY